MASTSAKVKRTPKELAGKWEMIKDTAGNEKRGLCLQICPLGPCLCVVCGVADKESMDKCCCPCFLPVPYIPIGGGTYMKCSSDICGPFMINGLEDGTIDGMMQGIYQKKGEKGAAAPKPAEMQDV